MPDSKQELSWAWTQGHMCYFHIFVSWNPSWKKETEPMSAMVEGLDSLSSEFPSNPKHPGVIPGHQGWILNTCTAGELGQPLSHSFNPDPPQSVLAGLSQALTLYCTAHSQNPAFSPYSTVISQTPRALRASKCKNVPVGIASSWNSYCPTYLVTEFSLHATFTFLFVCLFVIKI